MVLLKTLLYDYYRCYFTLLYKWKYSFYINIYNLTLLQVKAKHVKKEFKKSKFKKDGNPVKKEKNEIQELNRNGDLKGFSLSKEENLLEEHGTSKKKGKNKGGGFQSMGLSYPVLKGIIKRGYKVPTPIQRKVFNLSIN